MVFHLLKKVECLDYVETEEIYPVKDSKANIPLESLLLGNYLYKSDKEKCVELIKYLIYVSYRENYNVDLVDNGIILNTHSTEWIDTLIKRKNDYDQIRDEDNKKRR